MAKQTTTTALAKRKKKSAPKKNGKADAVAAAELQRAAAEQAGPFKLNQGLSRLTSLCGHISLHFGAIADTEPFSASAFVKGGYCTAQGRTIGHAVKKLDRLIASAMANG